MTPRMEKACIAVLAATPPLVLAVAGWVNAHAHRIEAEAQQEAKLELSDSFEEYIIYVMKQRGCEP